MTKLAEDVAELASPEARAADPVKSGHRTLLILEALAAAPGPMAFTELRMQLGVPKSSLHGLLNTLVAANWVIMDARTGMYGVGPRSLRVGAAYLERDPVVMAASPLLAHLRNQLDETVHLARIDGPDVVYLVSQESKHHLRSVSRIGRSQPTYATSLGQVLLAQRPVDVVRELLPQVMTPLTADTITSPEVLIETLAVVRERGWAIERGQNTPGLGCVAVAVPGRHPATDAISCSVPLNRLTDERVNDIADALVACAGEIGQSVPGFF
jgi:DNA-binding IclR family transcriptional regulator